MGKVAKIKKFDTGGESYDVQQDLGNRKKLHVRDLLSVQPKTDNQAALMSACFENIPLVVGAGSAGTGKTFLALYSALHQVLDQSTPYQKILMVRSAVASRDLGFLPGTLEEKESVFEAPYIGLASELFPKFNSPYNHLKSLGYYEFKSTSFLRGCTFDDTIIIVDEFQNLNRHEAYSILTRVGCNTKVILCGDTKQDDLKKSQSCFQYVKDLSQKMDNDDVRLVEFGVDDIVRSGFVRSVIIADELV